MAEGQSPTLRIDAARLASAGARIVHLRVPASEARTPPQVAEPGAIAMGYNGQIDAVVRLGSGKTALRTVPPRSIGLTGGEPVQWLRTERYAEVVEVTGSETLRRQAATELGVERHWQLADLHGVDDPQASAILDRFRAAARCRVFLSDMETDALVRRLYGVILCHQFGGVLRERSRAGLDPVRLRLVLDFIEHNLQGELTMGSLADVVGLSPFHFSRAFRTATGWSPHQYVCARRLEGVRRRIVTGREPIETIAFDFGYWNLSHFRRQFRALMGVPPSALRNVLEPVPIRRATSQERARSAACERPISPE